MSNTARVMTSIACRTGIQPPRLITSRPERLLAPPLSAGPCTQSRGDNPPVSRQIRTKRPEGRRGSQACEHDVECDASPRLFQKPTAGRRARRMLGEVGDETVLDAEHRVLVQVRIPGDEDMRDQRAVPGRVYLEVQVGGPHRTPARGGEQVTHGPVIRDRIGGRAHRPEPVSAVRGAAQPAASSGPAVGVLNVVEAVLVGLPHLDTGPGHRLTAGAADGAGRVAGTAAGIAGDVAAQRDLRRARHEERADHGGLGGSRRRRGIDGHGHHGEPEHVREQDELLTPVVGDVPGPGQEVDALLPLGLGEPHLARERMHVPHQALHDLPEAGRVRAAETGQHLGGHRVLAAGLRGTRARAFPNRTCRTKGGRVTGPGVPQ